MRQRAFVSLFLIVSFATVTLFFAGNRAAAGRPSRVIRPRAATDASFGQAAANLQGKPAFDYLKQHGLYDRLRTSIEAAEYELDGFFTQSKKLSASDPAINDKFGTSVSISGDTVVVGAYGQNTTGAAYIFGRNQGGANNWGQVKKVTAGDAATGDWFGFSVSLSGDTMVVGARNNSSVGAAYIFGRNQGGANNWGQVQKLSPGDPIVGGNFGESVSISGDTVVVGGIFSSFVNTGTAYIFGRNQGGTNNWGQVQKLTPSDPATYNGFAYSVSIDDDTLVVGDNGDDLGIGAAYFFERNLGGANHWRQVKKLTPGDVTPDDHVRFGASVSISGDTAVVGAAEQSPTGVYIFGRNQGGANNWGQVKKLTGGATSSRFGSSVSINGDAVVVGDSSGGPVNSSFGEAFMFRRNQGGADNWGQVHKLIAGDPAFTDLFGWSVGISGDTVVAGAPKLNGRIASNPGAGYIFDFNGPLISFSATNYNVNESDGVVHIAINRTGDMVPAVNVDYATAAPGASVNCDALSTGLASSRCDFAPMFGTLRFAANETQKTFDIPINKDAYAEGAETFTINLSNLTGGPLVTPSAATVTINDSAPPAPNAIDDTATFVRQQYRDFLNREADPGGLAFWTGEINNCTPKPQCTDLKRVNVSAAFFLSIEFQTTGNLVRNFYVATLNRPATNNMPAIVEFERDTQAMQRGVIVDPNNNAWQTVLNNNRDAFMSDFVTRTEFVALYPTTDTPAQYVDKLYAHAAVTPANGAERQAAIDEFAGAGTAADPGARGRALLRITQNAAFVQREMNRSFVQMEYFGYLRRNPNDAPDTSFAGYEFWLNKLNAAGGNFVTSDMVKSFLVSGEYRRRFGP